MDAARKEADLACSSLNNDICNIVRNSIDITDHISKVYGDMISSGIIPLTGESDKDAMLINFLKNHSENISVFAYMDRDDNIYTAIKQDNQEIKVIYGNSAAYVQNADSSDWLTLAKTATSSFTLPIGISDWSSVPTVRSIFPIFDDNDFFFGALYIEIDMKSMLSQITKTVNSYTDAVYIIDKDTDKVLFDINTSQSLSESSIENIV
jgi:hypothetical protein